MTTPPAVDQRRAAQALRELRQIQRELAERDLLRRSDALDEVQEAVERIGELGSSAAILGRAAEALGTSSSFARVLIGRIDGDRLVHHSIWARSGVEPELAARLQETVVALEYPLVEAEVASRGADAVAVAAGGPRSPLALRELLDWRSYVIAPLRLRGSTIGLIHAEPEPGRELGEELDREVAAIYAKGLAAAFERAVLRETIQRHREELGAAVVWMSDHLDRDLAGALPAAEPEARAAESAPGEHLTPRETEVLELLGRGQTNAAIAATLLISESTVKFHVKNILLKLGATSRADAVARHLRGDA